MMSLAVTGKHDIEQLEQWVVNKFSDVKNKNVELPDLGTPTPFPPENLGKLVKFVPIKDKDVMTILWNLPYV